MRDRSSWDFSHYFEELVVLSEILEIPGTEKALATIVEEMWDKYPTECESVGMRKPQQLKAA